MKRFALPNKKWLGLTAGFLAILAGVAWLERQPLLNWYYLRGLAKAGEGDRDAWAERVAGLDAKAVPGLLGLLGKDDARACANAQVALTRLGTRWGRGDARLLDLADQLVNAFPCLSTPGQQAALQAMSDWLRARKPLPAALVRSGTRLLTQVARVSEEQVHAPALELAAVVLEQAGPGNECRELIRVCLADKEPGHRLRAVQLAREPQLKLFKEAVSLLGDPAVEVRRAAILAVGSASQEEVVDDDLLRSLHDPDEDVRRTCEAVLRSEPRRFTEEQLKLSRLLTDDDPAVRLQVLDYLHRRSDLEPGVWLRRLSHDSERAVRAAALRTAAEQTLVDLSDRMAQMAQSDPSPTVCELARYFLSYQKRRQSQPSRP